MRKIFLLFVILFVYGMFNPPVFAGGKGNAVPTELVQPEVIVVPPPMKKPCEPKKTVTQTTSGGFGFFAPVMVGTSACNVSGGLGGGGVFLPSTTQQRVDIDYSECE